MKKIISMLMVMVIIITSTGFVSACSAKEASEITMGDWLVLINDLFGMEYYISETPYYDEILEDNPYFEVVQIATEWKVIDVKEELDLYENVTWKQALITLVNVGEFVDYTATEEEKVEYGIKHFNSEIRSYWLNRNIDISSAMLLLSSAHDQWVNKKYDVSNEKISLVEGVINYAEEEQRVDNYAFDDNGDIIIPISENPQIEKDDVFILPNIDGSLGISTYKARDVIIEDNIVRVCVDSNLELSDVVDELYIQETLEPTAENMTVYDANGNIIYAAKNIENISTCENNKEGIKLNYNLSNSGMMVQTAKNSNSSKFNLDGFSVELKVTFVNGKPEIKATLSKKLKEFKNGAKLDFEAINTLKDIDVTTDYDFSLGKLNSASLKVDYESKNEVGIKLKGDIKDLVAGPDNNRNTKFLKNLNKSSFKDRDTGTGAKTIKIGSIDLANGGAVRVCLDITFKISADGTAKIVVTESGTKGIQYKNGTIRTISENERSLENVELKAKIEATLGIGPAVYAVGLKKSIVGLSVRIGAGTSGTFKLNHVDAEQHLLETVDMSDCTAESCEGLKNCEIIVTGAEIKEIARSQGVEYEIDEEATFNTNIESCMEIAIYLIVRLEIESSYLKDFLNNLKIKGTIEIFGEKNAVLARVHVDNWNWENRNIKFGIAVKDDLCTLKHKDFESTKEDETESVEIDTEIANEDLNSEIGMEINDKIELNQFKMNIKIGEINYLQVKQLPDGYNINDIVFESSDTSIVKVNDKGEVHALDVGSVVIKISTRDSKYQVHCAITVLSSDEVEAL